MNLPSNFTFLLDNTGPTCTDWCLTQINNISLQYQYGPIWIAIASFISLVGYLILSGVRYSDNMPSYKKNMISASFHIGIWLMAIYLILYVTGIQSHLEVRP